MSNVSTKDPTRYNSLNLGCQYCFMFMFPSYIYMSHTRDLYVRLDMSKVVLEYQLDITCFQVMRPRGFTHRPICRISSDDTLSSLYNLFL